MFETRADPTSPNYHAAVWYGIGKAMKYLISMKPNHRLESPYDTPRCRERLAFFEQRLAAMPEDFRDGVELEARRLPSSGCTDFIEIDAAEDVAGIILGGGTLYPAGEHGFEVVGYNEMIEAFSYEIIANLSSVTIPYAGESSDQQAHSARHRREWQDEYRAHIRSIASLLDRAGVSASADLLEAA